MAVPTARTLEPFRGSEAVRDGMITWARLRGPDFQRLFPDVHAGARATRDAALRVKALSLWAGPGAVASGPLAHRTATRHGLDRDGLAELVLRRLDARSGRG